MANKRKSVAMQNQIYELIDRGLSIRAVARTQGISRNTVKCILKRRQANIKAALNPLTVPNESQSLPLDWEAVLKERGKGICFNVLHKEFALEGWDYHKFWREFQKQFPHLKQTQNITMRLVHKPAEKTFFDFSDGIDIVNPQTGEITTTQFFCAVLPFSSYTYGEFIPSQKQPDFCRAIENSFHFFGGVTPYVTVDNLKSAITKAHLYDPDVNQGFCQFANHWQFAVLPARPYKPRDKASNESAIGVIQRSFFQTVRHQTFHSLHELNQAFRQYLLILNNQLMKEHGVSRMDRFQTEKPLLAKLPNQNYEIATHKIAKVHADCHIQIKNKFYSVPHLFVGQEVIVKMTEKLIQVFSKENVPLATHAKLNGIQRASTNELHYPEHKNSIVKFEVIQAQAQAKNIGPQTQQLIFNLVNSDWPLKHLRRIQGILRLVHAKTVSPAELEHAAELAIKFNKPNYGFIKSAALHHKNHGSRPTLLTPLRNPNDIYLHAHSNKN